MPFPVSPGVYFTENDYTGIVPGLSTYIGGFVGAFSWGPVGVIQTVANEPDLVNKFGRPNNDQFKYWFQAAGYLSYADTLKIIRVVGHAARNASSGGLGTGLTITTTALNGVVTGGTIVAAGTGYIVGDLILIPSTVVNARFRVTSVSGTGAVTGLLLVTGGAGLAAATAAATTVVNNVIVKNRDDLNDTVYPEIIAKYPGILGNGLTFSIVRASEFEGWAFKDRFVVAPAASSIVWTGDGTVASFALPVGTTTLPTGGVVVVDGNILKVGSTPGTYAITSGNLVINGDTQTFTGTGAASAFTLTNSSGLDTSQAHATIAGTAIPRYDSVGIVPPGYFAVNANVVTFGTNLATFNGDGLTSTFTVVGVLASAMADAKVKLGGITKIVDTSGTTAPSGHVIIKAASNGTDTLVIFNTAEVPTYGAANVTVEWGFPASAASIIVTFGAPKAVTNNVKVFYNQTECHAVVVDHAGIWSGIKDDLLERYEYMSLVPGTKYPDGTTAYYVDSITTKSKYVTLPTSIFTFGSKVLSGGVDANVPTQDITPGILQDGYSMFQNAEFIDVYHVIGGDADLATAEYLIGDIGEYRRDVVCYFSPPLAAAVNNVGNEADDIVAFRNLLPSTTYGHISSGWAYRYDRYNDTYRWVPLAGDDAGIYALTHETVDPWWSGAGFNRGRYRNVVKLSWSPNKTERDTLYSNGVNPSTWFKGEGPVLYGDKTMQTKPSAFDRMNVRWLFIVLEKSISKAAKYFLFEFNDAFTRNQFVNMVHPYLRDVQGRRGIQDFKIVCDDTNNTGVVIDRNEFIGDIYIKPARSINFIQLNFNAVATSVNFDEIIHANVTNVTG